MKAYLTKTRWNIVRLMRVEGTTHPRALTIDLIQRELNLSQRDAGVTLAGMVSHGLLARVGDEYRATRSGVEVLVATDTQDINQVTFEIPA